MAAASTSPPPVPKFALADTGVEMPAIGFGCAFGNWTDDTKPMRFEPEQGWAAIPAALRAGNTHFDCALVYGSHRQVGDAIGRVLADGTATREDFFIATKVFHPPTPLALNTLGRSMAMDQPGLDVKAEVRVAIERSLDELGMGYVDLMMMHWPGNFNTTDEQLNRLLRRQCWEVFEEQHRAGRLRSIGVSNFSCKHLETLIEDTTIVPHVNQIEISPFIGQKDVVDFCKEKGVQLVAWAPFGSGATGVLTDPVINQIAQKYNKNAGQIVLRWLTQRGIVALPKSSNEGRMRSNLDVFDITLTQEEMDAISALDQHKSSVITSENIA